MEQATTQFDTNFEAQFSSFVQDVARRFSERTGEDMETAVRKVTTWANENDDVFTEAFGEWSGR